MRNLDDHLCFCAWNICFKGSNNWRSSIKFIRTPTFTEAIYYENAEKKELIEKIGNLLILDCVLNDVNFFISVLLDKSTMYIFLFKRKDNTLNAEGLELSAVILLE